MNKLTISVVVVLAMMIVVFIPNPGVTGLAAKQNIPSKVSLPARAIEVSPNVYYLGTARDKGRVVEGYAIIDKRGYAKPTGCNNDGKCQGWEDATCGDCTGGGTSDSSCFGFLAKGAKWKTVEPFVVNPSNAEGLSDAFVLSNLVGDISKWEFAAAHDILGTGSLTTQTLVADMSSPDNKNEVYFADISNNGAIAITIIWGFFRGPPQSRELVEWDQVYDDVDFDWSDVGAPGKMDFENIATHELGHSVGLADIYQIGCSEETMYGYGANGETKKRTLESGDITGVRQLYS